MTDQRGYEVLAVKYGTRRTTRSEVFLNYHLYGEPDGVLDMDYFFWVVRNRHRTVLVDCGFSATGGAVRGRTQLIDPLAALEALGVALEDIDKVVLTHAHYDHIGNLARLPACEVVVAADEVEFWSSPYASRRQFAHSVEGDELSALAGAVADGRATLVRTEAQIAPGISVIKVGGHTPGQLVVTVQTQDGVSMLTSDSVHYYEELELDRPFAAVADVPDMYRAFSLVREFQQDRAATVVASHDPLVTERFAASADGPEGLVWRVG